MKETADNQSINEVKHNPNTKESVEFSDEAFFNQPLDINNLNPFCRNCEHNDYFDCYDIAGC